MLDLLVAATTSTGIKNLLPETRELPVKRIDYLKNLNAY